MMTKQKVEKTVRDIRRHTRKKYSAEEKIRIVLEGLRGEESIAELCAVVKALTLMCTNDGPKTSWKPVKRDWQEILPVKPTQMRSRRLKQKLQH